MSSSTLALLAISLYTLSTSAEPSITQSMTVVFPHSGSVIIQAREEFEQNPEVLFKSAATGKLLLRYTFAEPDGVLKPHARSDAFQRPFVRFQAIRVVGMPSPMILAIAVEPGGSDHGFYAMVIAEVRGRLRTLQSRPFLTDVQGGLYVGYLNSSLGNGLVVWNFIWNEGIHYDFHHYKIETYSLRGDRFIRQGRRVSRQLYDGNGADSLRELGIHATDLRATVPDLAGYLE